MSALSPPALPDKAPRAPAMGFIMLTVLIDMISIGIIVPVLPGFIGSFTEGPADQAYWLGIVSFAFGVANFFGAPILGALSDRFGRRPVLLLGFCGLALNFFATALATSIAMLITARLVGGLMQANAAIANAYVADITPPEQRAKRFGMLGAMFGIGFILGPIIGGLLGAISIHLPFYAAGALALLNLLYGYFVLPESLPPDRRRALSWSAANPLRSLRELARLKGVGSLMGAIALTGLAQFVMYTIWVLYNTVKFGWDTEHNGWSLAAVGVMAVIVQGALLGRLLKRFTAPRLAVLGMVSQTLAYAMYGLVSQGWMMYVVIAANIFGLTITASIQSIVSQAASESNQGQTMGSVSSLNSLMAVIAPILGAPILAGVTHLATTDWRMGAPFFLCAALQAGALILAINHFRRPAH